MAQGMSLKNAVRRTLKGRIAWLGYHEVVWLMEG